LIGDTVKLHRVKELFGEAIDLPPRERAAFLEQACGGDESLRAAVDDLLRSHEEAGEFLDKPTLGGGVDHSPPPAPQPLPIGDVGPYKVLERIGEGGFGAIYLAEQTHPVRRQVALKILKPFGIDSRQIMARFDAERQALALMEHPSIARVYDAGTTPDGRPFFAMEFVRGGVPITQYCDARQLGMRKRIELFVAACNAVHHAHQKGVIHRDIKPANVLVAEIDGAAVPKVIDFGIAKASQATRLTDLTLVTEIRQLIGTPEYMSPEQAASGGTDIDTRSDVYSLGVLLYELLAGRTPFDAEELRNVSLAEMQRRICEVDPPRPSTRIDETRVDVAARRSSEPARLRTLLRGELDWIAMKCLEKDRARRYESAAALAADCQAFLDGRPVQARPTTRLYRVRKFVRRHKLPVGAAAATFVALAASLVVTSASLYQAKRDRDRALAANAAEAEAREVAEEHVRFIEGMFLSIKPEQAKGRNVTVREILDEAAARVATAFPGRPRVEAAVRETFGVAYMSIGELQRARQQYDEALAYLDPTGDAGLTSQDQDLRIRLMMHLGETLREQGDYAEGEKRLRAAWADALARRGPGDPLTISAGDALATLLFHTDRREEAEKIRAELARQIETAEQTPAIIASAIGNDGNRGMLAQARGDAGEAERLYRSAFDRANAAYGEDHPDAIAIKLSLASALRDKSDFEGALALMEDALARSQRVLGAEHPSTLTVAHATALLLSANRRTPDAEKLLAQTIAACRKTLGENHPTTLYTRYNLVQILLLTRRTDQAEGDLRDIVERMKVALGPDHRDTLMQSADLARCRTSAGDWAGGEAIYREILPRMERVMGPDHPYTLSVRMRLGNAIGRQDRWPEAEALLRPVYQQKKASGDTQRDYSSAMNFGVCLEKIGKHEEAIPVLLEADQAMRKFPRIDPNLTRSVLTALANSYEKTNQPEKAAEVRQRVKDLPPPTTRPHAG
jgi:eukaryotic-like serine/threonine-protein kinase